MPTLNKDLFTAYVGYFFRYIYLLLLIPLYARVLGPESYGVVLAAMSVQNIVWNIQNWGFAYTGLRNIAAAKSSDERTTEFNRQLTARLLLLPAAIAIGIAFTQGTPLLRSEPTISILAIACGIMAGYNLGWYFQGTQRFKTSVYLEVLGFAITLPLVLLLVNGPEDSTKVILSILISSAVVNLTSYILAARDILIKPAQTKTSIDLIKEATPLFISGGAFTLLANIGTFSLATFSTADQVAFFGTAEKILTAGLGLLGPVGQVLLSRLSAATVNNDSELANLKQQESAVKWVTLAGLACTIASLTLAPPILSFALGSKFDLASTALAIMSPVFTFAAFNNAVAVYIMLPRRLDKVVSKIGIISAISSTIFVACGAYIGGAVGAAIARSVSEVFCCGLTMFYYYKLKINIKSA